MFLFRAPRVFVLASAALLFLVTYTTLHLYHHVPPSHPVADTPGLPLKDAIAPERLPNPEYAVASETEGDGLAKSTTTAAPSPTIQDGSPIGSPADNEPPAQSPPQPIDLGGGSFNAGDRPGEEAQLLLPDPKLCPRDLQFLVRSSIGLKLTERVRYSRRYIHPAYSDTVDRDDVANITEPLIWGEVEVDLNDCQGAAVPQSAPIRLRVPNPHPKATYAHLIFGVATDYNRLNDSITPFAHWISGSSAKLVAVVTDARDKQPEDIERLQHSFEQAGIDATLVKPINESFTTPQNHFAVLISMLQLGGPDTRWYGIIDDDTFFPALKPLSDSLATLDHGTDAYVGALSEDFQSVRSFGFMAFGGAGAFLSAPLAKKLGDQALRCIEEATTREGDTILRDCVYANSKAKLTMLPGLFQQDIRDDVSGFFEAGLKPLNLHHWKSWYKEPVEKMAKAVKICGDCFLQRWRFGTDTVFTNGFSIATYRDGVDSVNLQLMEGTWDRADSKDFDFSLGPLRRPYPADQKRSYKLREAEITDDGDLKQLYVRVGNASEGELDQVVELVWQKH